MIFKRCLLSLAALATFLPAMPSFAALQTYHGDFTVTSTGNSFGSASGFVVGDTFHFQFTLDDAVVDNNSFGSFCVFPNLYTSFSFTRDSANNGTWDPGASGTWTLPTGGGGNGSSGSMSFFGNGFPSVALFASSPFPDFATTTSAQLNFNFSQSHTDTGAGQSFADMFGTINPTGYDVYLVFSGEGESGPIDADVLGTVNNFTPGAVPEPATWTLFLAGFGVMGGMVRRKSVV